MKKNLITVLLVFLVPVVVYFGINLMNTSVTSSVGAKTTKPQIVKFTSTMCIDCQTMNKIIKEIYPQYKDKVELTEINVQDGNPKNDEWIKKYEVSLVPTIILIDSNGNKTKRIEGAISKEELETCIRDLK